MIPGLVILITPIKFWEQPQTHKFGISLFMKTVRLYILIHFPMDLLKQLMIRVLLQELIFLAAHLVVLTFIIMKKTNLITFL